MLTLCYVIWLKSNRTCDCNGSNLQQTILDSKGRVWKCGLWLWLKKYEDIKPILEMKQRIGTPVLTELIGSAKMKIKTPRVILFVIKGLK